MKASSLTVSLIFISPLVLADDLYFNPDFFSEQGENIDLTIYEKQMQPTGEYPTNIFINDQFRKTVNLKYIRATENHAISGDNAALYPCIDAKLLEELGVNTEGFDSEIGKCLVISEVNEFSTLKFNFIEQRLYISIPQQMLKKNFSNSANFDTGMTAGFINYNLNTNIDSDHSEQYFANLASGINIGAWRLRNHSTYSRRKSKNSSLENWDNVSTYLERPLLDLRSNLTIGETNTSNSLFDSTPFRGVKISSAKEMLPNKLQGFAPELKGVARTQAKITVRQNGHISYQTTVPPGPYLISDMNPTGSSGDLEVTIEEADGTTEVKRIPFSVLPILQRAGNYDYELSFGKFKSNSDFQESFNFAEGSFVYGASNTFTMYTGTQLADRYQSLVLGFGANLGSFGAFSADITQAFSELYDGNRYNGQSLRFLFSKNLNKFGTTVKLLGYRYSTKDFYTLNDTAYTFSRGYETDSEFDFSGNIVQRPYSYYNLENNKKGRFQFNISQNLEKYGSLYFTLDSQSYWNTTEKTKNINLGYSFYYNSVNFNLSYNEFETLGFNNKERNISLGVNIPLGKVVKRPELKTAYVNTNYNNSNSFGDTLNASFSGTTLENNNLGYSVSTNTNFDNNTTSLSGNVNYLNNYGRFNAGYFTSDTNNNFSASMEGGVLFHENGVTFGQSLGETSILIKAKDAPNIGITNRAGIKTDYRGYAILPHAEAYRENTINLNINSLSDKVEITNNINVVTPTRGAIVSSDFKTTIGHKALITLNKDDEYIPFGSAVFNEKNNSSGIVGDSGVVYMTGLQSTGTLKVNIGNDSSNSCFAQYDIPNDKLKQSIIELNLDCNQ